MAEATTVILGGDVMTGRGVDQVLPHPGPPRLQEEFVVDARSYVDLAERVNGPIPKPVEAAWPWGDALAVMDEEPSAVRVMNLETSVTGSEERAPRKAVHYRMSPDNLACLEVARADVWTLANNHVLDHGRPGLLETLTTLHDAALRTAGAGADENEAWTPAVIERPSARVVVCSVAHVSSGVPTDWTASGHRPGVALLPDLSEGTAEMVADLLLHDARPGDVRVVSVHWGGNWGYGVSHEQRRFAHRLLDTGVHVVHGHSSHHPRPVEVYHDRLVVYGCGDLVNDYEGIGGHAQFRDDLRLLYLAELAVGSGELCRLRMVPFQARRMRLWRATREDGEWLARRLTDVSGGLGGSLAWDEEGISLLPAAC
jgi:poly-gamma-glutamate capsule biosynthesis protein CapA/YwtB (metallophosphatase superfamily)